MAAKKKADNPAFTGRNVALTEIAQTSGISVAALKQGLRVRSTSVMLSPAVRARCIAITVPTSKYGKSSVIISRTQIPKPPESL